MKSGLARTEFAPGQLGALSAALDILKATQKNWRRQGVAKVARRTAEDLV